MKYNLEKTSSLRRQVPLNFNAGLVSRIKQGHEKVLLGNVFCHGENLFIQVETTAPPPRRRTFKKRSFRYGPFPSSEVGLSVCVCVCVCEREREREREGWMDRHRARERECVCVCVCMCVCEREREMDGQTDIEQENACVCVCVCVWMGGLVGV